MKKFRVLWILLCVMLMIFRFVAPAHAVDASVANGCHSVDAAFSLSESKQMLKTSKAAILYERNSDTLVYSWNADEKIYPSSMVKLMTALVALEKGDLADTVTVTKSALSNLIPGSLCLKPILQVGEVLSLESLLYALMTPSANDAAVVIAEHIAGSQDAFIALMNEKAQELGCTGTHYSNVHGLHDEQTYTTARDICRLLDIALENEQYKTLFTAKEYSIPATNLNDARNIVTSNHMMSKAETPKHFDERVTGGKTGSTDKAGRCLAVTAEANGMEYLAIVMGAVPTYNEDGTIVRRYGSFEEMKELLDFGFSGFGYSQIFYENQVLAQYPVSGGENHVVTMPVSQLSTVLPLEYDKALLNWTFGEIGNLSAPIEAGQQISEVQVWYGDLCLAQTQQVAMTDVNAYQAPTTPDTDEQLTEDSEGSVAIWIILGILGAVVLIVIFVIVLRVISAARLRARRRRRQQDRRRKY